MPETFSPQDIEDLKQVHAALVAKKDPRADKVAALISSQPPDFAANPPAVPKPSTAMSEMPTSPILKTLSLMGSPLRDVSPNEETRKSKDEIGTGYAKGIASTAHNVATLPWALSQGRLPTTPESLKPSSQEQNMGYAGEQLSEFMAPGGLIGKGVKAAEATNIGARLPFLTRLLSRAGLEGVSAGAVSAAHGENPAPAAEMAAAGGATSEALPIVGKLLKSQASSLYGRALAPTTKNAKYLTSEKVVPGLLDRSAWGTLKGLGRQAEEGKTAASDAIDQIASTTPLESTIKTKPIIESLDNFKQKFVVDGVPLDKQAIAPIEELQGTISKLGDSVSYDSLRKARQIFDGPVAKAGGYAGTNLSDQYSLQAKKAGANAIRSELAKADPDIAKLNAEYHFWSNVGDVVDATLLRKSGQQGGILGSGMSEVGGAIAHGVPGVAVGAVANTARKGAISTAARSFRSVQWNKLGNALQDGNIQEAQRMVSRLVAGSTSTGKP